MKNQYNPFLDQLQEVSNYCFPQGNVFLFDNGDSFSVSTRQHWVKVETWETAWLIAKNWYENRSIYLALVQEAIKSITWNQWMDGFYNGMAKENEMKACWSLLTPATKKFFLATNGRGSFSFEGVKYQFKKATKKSIRELIAFDFVVKSLVVDGIQYYDVTEFGKEVYKII